MKTKTKTKAPRAQRIIWLVVSKHGTTVHRLKRDAELVVRDVNGFYPKEGPEHPNCRVIGPYLLAERVGQR